VSSLAQKFPRLSIIAALCINLGAHAADDRDSLFGDDLPLAEAKPAVTEGGGPVDGGDIPAAKATTSADGPIADPGDASASQISEEARKAGKQG